jgi:putative transposase
MALARQSWCPGNVRPRNTMRAMANPRQRSFEFPTWGGKRAGSGRKRVRARRAVPHRARGEFRPYQPVHVTVRMASHVWNLRSQRSFAIVHGVLADVRARGDFRVAEFSIQGNHVHLIVEASGPGALGRGMRALSIRLARRLNGMMGRRGSVLEDRYYTHVLRTPAEVRNALRYVRGNFAGHACRWGERVSARWVDPFTSAAGREPRREQRVLWSEPVTREAETWLLRTAVTPELRRRIRPAGRATRPCPPKRRVDARSGESWDHACLPTAGGASP